MIFKPLGTVQLNENSKVKNLAIVQIIQNEFRNSQFKFESASLIDFWTSPFVLNVDGFERQSSEFFRKSKSSGRVTNNLATSNFDFKLSFNFKSLAYKYTFNLKVLRALATNLRRPDLNLNFGIEQFSKKF